MSEGHTSVHEGRAAGREARAHVSKARILLAALVAVVSALAFLQLSVVAHEDHDHSHGEPDTLRIAGGDSTFPGLRGGEHPHDLTLEATGMRFRLRATGSGVLEDEDGALYEAVLYVDRSVGRGDDAASDVLAAGYARRIELHLCRDFPGGTLVRHLQPAFENLSDVPGDMRDYFLAQLDESLEAGQSVEFTWVPGLGLNTYVAGHWHPVIQNRRFGDALLAFWLGAEPVSQELKADLFRLARGAVPAKGTGSR